MDGLAAKCLELLTHTQLRGGKNRRRSLLKHGHDSEVQTGNQIKTRGGVCIILWVTYLKGAHAPNFATHKCAWTWCVIAVVMRSTFLISKATEAH